MLTQAQREVLKQVVNILETHNIPYQITGALAAVAYGAKRPLYDIDIDVHKKDLPKVKKIFSEYIKEDTVHLQDEHFDMYLLHFDVDGVPVDISQAEDCYFTDKAGTKIRMDSDLATAQEMDIEDIKVFVQNKQDLITYKKILGRETDIQDIEDFSRTNK